MPRSKFPFQGFFCSILIWRNIPIETSHHNCDKGKWCGERKTQSLIPSDVPQGHEKITSSGYSFFCFHLVLRSRFRFRRSFFPLLLFPCATNWIRSSNNAFHYSLLTTFLRFFKRRWMVQNYRRIDVAASAFKEIKALESHMFYFHLSHGNRQNT